MIEHLGAVREPISDSDVAQRDTDLGKILLLGEDNPQSSSPEFQLYPRPSGCSGHRLQSRVLGLTRESDYLAIWRANLCTPVWDNLEARKRAWILIGDATPWDVIILLGRKVSKIFACMIEDTGVDLSLAPFKAAFALGKTFVSLPHPSGRCKEWLETGKFAHAQMIIRHATPKLMIPWGGTMI